MAKVNFLKTSDYLRRWKAAEKHEAECRKKLEEAFNEDVSGALDLSWDPKWKEAMYGYGLAIAGALFAKNELKLSIMADDHALHGKGAQD